MCIGVADSGSPAVGVAFIRLGNGGLRKEGQRVPARDVVVKPNPLVQVLTVAAFGLLLISILVTSKPALSTVIYIGILGVGLVGSIISFGDRVVLRADHSLLVTVRRFLVIRTSYEIRPLRDSIRVVVFVPIRTGGIEVRSRLRGGTASRPRRGRTPARWTHPLA